MGGSLKLYLLREELRRNHAEHFLQYKERYHHEVFHDLKVMMSKEWEAWVKQLSKTNAPSADSVESAKLENDDALVALELSTKSEKMIAGRYSTPVETALSVKIPFVYDHLDRTHLSRYFIKESKEVFEKLSKSWREIFHYEQKGKMVPNFRIVSDSEEVRFQMYVSDSGHDSYSTLYVVRLEHGKRGKTKNFDRVYLLSLI